MATGVGLVVVVQLSIRLISAASIMIRVTTTARPRGRTKYLVQTRSALVKCRVVTSLSATALTRLILRQTENAAGKLSCDGSLNARRLRSLILVEHQEVENEALRLSCRFRDCCDSWSMARAASHAGGVCVSGR